MPEEGVLRESHVIGFNTCAQSSFRQFKKIMVLLCPPASMVRPTLRCISKMPQKEVLRITVNPSTVVMLNEVKHLRADAMMGSQLFERARFFALLRMTIKVKRFVTRYATYPGAQPTTTISRE